MDDAVIDLLCQVMRSTYIRSGFGDPATGALRKGMGSPGFILPEEEEEEDDDDDDKDGIDFFPPDDDTGLPTGEPRALATMRIGTRRSLRLMGKPPIAKPTPPPQRRGTRWSRRLMEKAQNADSTSTTVSRVRSGRVGKRRKPEKPQKPPVAETARLEQIVFSNNHGGAQVNTTVRNFKVVVQDRVHALFFANEIIELRHSSLAAVGPRIIFFADGSYRKNMAGVGVSYKRCLAETTGWIDASAGIFGVADSTDAEMIAVGMALNIARCEVQNVRHTAGPQSAYPTIFIITDSQSALQWVGQCVQGKIFTKDGTAQRHHHPAFTQVLDPLVRLESLGVKVEFHWTKGHKKVDGNVRADGLAGRAAKWMLTLTGQDSWKKDDSKAYQVCMTPDTSPEVLGMFTDREEDITLLLEDAQNNQPSRDDCDAEGLLAN